MTNGPFQSLVIRALGDLCLGLLAFFAAYWIRASLPLPWTVGLLPEDRLPLITGAVVLVVLSQNLLLYLFGFYDTVEPLGRLDLLKRLFGATAIQGLAIATFFFLTNLPFPRSVLVLFVPINLFLLFVFRFLYQKFYRLPPRRLAIVGHDRTVVDLAENINRYHWHGFEVAGFVLPPGIGNPSSCCNSATRLGTFEELPGLLGSGAIDGIILAHNPDDWHTHLIDRLSQSGARGEVLLLPTPFQSLIGRARFRSIHDLALVEVIGRKEWTVNDPLKRLFDMAVASVLLVLSAPVMAVCALAVRVTSPGPILFRQERVGRGRRPFVLMKFRTMREDAEAQTGETLASQNDPRVTPIGRTLRRFRLDELPQLWNVLSGDMSLVGPRPERPGFVNRFLEEIPGYAERFSVKPGLTGLAQVNGNYYTTAENKLRYDLAYVANWSIWLDFSVLFKTAKIVLSRPGS